MLLRRESLHVNDLITFRQIQLRLIIRRSDQQQLHILRRYQCSQAVT